jgi:hypothetical protein
MARLLLPSRRGITVFRAAVLSVALTLAMGPNGSLLCSMWCYPQENRASACQHQDATTSPQVTGGDSCRTDSANRTTLVREEAKRGTPTPDAQHAVAIPRFRFTPPAIHTTRAYQVTTSHPADAPPILVALRL